MESVANTVGAGVASGNPLATSDQLALEDLALRLYRSKPVAEAKERARPAWLADPRANSASGKRTVAQDLDEVAFHACCMAAIDTPDDPKVFWGFVLPHRWFGRDIPGARVGIDNPDNIYRLMAINAQSSYVVSGRVVGKPPADMSFTVFPVWPGVIEANADGLFPAALGGLTLKDLDVDAEGRFTLTLSPDPANNRRNYLQIKPGAKNLFVRDSLADWAKESPPHLSIRRVSGPPIRPPGAEPALSELAARYIDLAARFWLEMPAHYYYKAAANRFATTINPAFAKGGQFTANGHFALKPDEAVVFTLDPLGAGYVSVQLADLYGASLDYAHHTASLSHAQMAPNKDGTITYVLSLQDPGVHNWLDPTGLDTGLYMFRYQAYDPDKATLQAAVRSEQTVKLADLDRVLPSETRRVSSAERRQQLAERLAAYNRRLREQRSS